MHNSDRLIQIIRKIAHATLYIQENKFKNNTKCAIIEKQWNVF